MVALIEFLHFVLLLKIIYGKHFTFDYILQIDILFHFTTPHLLEILKVYYVF